MNLDDLLRRAEELERVPIRGSDKPSADFARKGLDDLFAVYMNDGPDAAVDLFEAKYKLLKDVQLVVGEHGGSLMRWDDCSQSSKLLPLNIPSIAEKSFFSFAVADNRLFCGITESNWGNTELPYNYQLWELGSNSIFHPAPSNSGHFVWRNSLHFRTPTRVFSVLDNKKVFAAPFGQKIDLVYVEDHVSSDAPLLFTVSNFSELQPDYLVNIGGSAIDQLPKLHLLFGVTGKVLLCQNKVYVSKFEGLFDNKDTCVDKRRGRYYSVGGELFFHDEDTIYSINSANQFNSVAPYSDVLRRNLPVVDYCEPYWYVDLSTRVDRLIIRYGAGTGRINIFSGEVQKLSEGGDIQVRGFPCTVQNLFGRMSDKK